MYHVIIRSVGPNRVRVLRLVQSLAGCTDIRQALARLETAAIFPVANLELAENYLRELRKVGADARLLAKKGYK